MTPRASTTDKLGNSLAAMLLKLPASGLKGFEGLVATLMQEAFIQPFLLAASGLQDGADSYSPRVNAFQAAIECKRYGRSKPLSARDLVTQVGIAWQANPDLDVWLLVTTREVTTQQDEALSDVCDSSRIREYPIAQWISARQYSPAA